MNLPIKSFGNLDSLKEGDIVLSPSLEKIGNGYNCVFYRLKIKNFLAKTVSIELKDKVNFDKFDVTLERQFPENVQLDESEKAEQNLTTNLRNGFCTDDEDAKLKILAAFKKEFKNMASAVDKQMKQIKS